jgi:hypothetical protein
MQGFCGALLDYPLLCVAAFNYAPAWGELEDDATHIKPPVSGGGVGGLQYRPQANIVDCPALSAAGAYRWRGRGKWLNVNDHQVLSEAL